MAPSKKAPATAPPEEAPEPKKQTLLGGLGLSASCFSKEARTAPDSKRVVRAGAGGAGGQPSIKAFGICLSTGTGSTNDGKPQAKFDVFVTHTDGMGGTPQALLSDGTVDYVAETKKIELTPEQIEEAEAAAGGRRVAKPRELVVNGEATKLDYCLASIIKNKDDAPAAGAKDAAVDPVAGQLVELRNITTTRAYSSAAGCDKIFLNVSRANAVGNTPEDAAQAIFDFACRPEVLAKSAQALLQSCEAFASISPNDAQAQQLQAAKEIFEQRTSAAMSSLLTASAASETTAGAEFLKDLSTKIPSATDHAWSRRSVRSLDRPRHVVAIAVNAGPPWAPEPVNPPTAEQFAVVWPSNVDVGEKNSFVVTFKAAVCMDKEALDQSLEKGESGILTTGERHFAAMFSLGLAAGQLGCTLRSALAPALCEIIPYAKFTFFPELLVNNTFSGELRQKLAGGARLFFKLDESLRAPRSSSTSTSSCSKCSPRASSSTLMTKFQSMRTRITQSCTCPCPRTQSLPSTIRTASRRSPKVRGAAALLSTRRQTSPSSASSSLASPMLWRRTKNLRPIPFAAKSRSVQLAARSRAPPRAMKTPYASS